MLVKAIRCSLVAALPMMTSVPSAMARDLVYTPVSPSFGGSPLNGSYVLGLAAANNYQYTESPEAKKQRRTQQALQGDTSPAAQFERQITASLLSQVASTIGQQILGENARNSGTFAVGSTTVNFNRVGGQVNIDIVEGSTGARTNIQIPVPQF